MKYDKLRKGGCVPRRGETHKMKGNGKTVLFSPVGGTDPISNQRDGALLHICRHYHPECVMLYLSKEMLEWQQTDDRYRRSLKLLAEEEGFALEILCEERPEMDNPHLFDLFYEDFERCVHALHERYPGRRVLLNLSSGTPAMKSALMLFPYLLDLPVCGVQVSSPQKAHNGVRESLPGYDVNLAWECNLDRRPEEFEDRCEEPKMENLRAKLQRRTLEAHLKVYDYTAALEAGLQMGKLLPGGARELLQAAALRARNEWKKIAPPLRDRLIAPGSLEEKAILEYTFSLQALQQRGEVAEFLRGLTPALYQLSLYALKKLVKIDLERYCNDRGDLVSAKMEPQLFNAINAFYRDGYRNHKPNSDLCIKLLGTFCPQHACVTPLQMLRKVEEGLRNVAAHTIQPVPEEVVRQKSREILVGNGYAMREEGSQAILRLLQMATEAVFARGPLGWDAYDRMNEAIRAALDETPAL